METRPGYLLILIIVSFSFAVYPQKREIKFENYNISNGLSHNTVHSIIQDEKGFLWIGTEDGLNMFDGYTFTTFKKNIANPYSISDNFIYCLYQDKKQNLWIGTNNAGLNSYNKISGQFKSYQTYVLNGKTIPIRLINAITEDSNGDIWFGAFGGLFEFNPDSSKIVANYHQTDSAIGLSDNDIRSLYMDKNDVLWIGTDKGGLNRFDLKDKTIKYYQNNRDTSSLSNNSVSCIFRDKLGKLCVGTNWGFNLLDEKTGKFKRFLNNLNDPLTISNNVIYCIYEDNLNNLWIGTLNGLNIFNRKDKVFYNWKSNPLINTSISDSHIFSVFEDKYGQVWVGTSTKGLNKFNNHLKNFKSYFHDPINSNSLSNNTVREIYQDSDGYIWIGVIDGGLNVYNPKNKQFQHFNHNPSDNKSISENRVTSILKDSKNNIWIGTWDGGLNRAIYKNGNYRFDHFFHHPSYSKTIASNIILEIVEDRWGRIWLGTGEGLDLFDEDKKQSRHYTNEPGNPNSLVHNSIQSCGIVFDKFDNIWIGTWGGLSKAVLSKTTHLPEKFLQYQQNDTSGSSINDNRILALHVDNKNNIWVGTFGGGLNKVVLDDKGNIKTIKHYTEKDGLPNEVVYGILEDKKGLLWLSTNNGLSEFNPESEKFNNYDENDGLQSNQFYWGAAGKLNSGELAFGGINGFNTFFPDSIFIDKTIPDIIITDFKIFNQNVEISSNSKLTKNIIYSDTINLNYDDKVISFEFSALQFADPSKNKYAYKLDGFDKQWIYTNSKKRFAVYTNLDPGVYTFMVKGSNSDGIWNEKSTNIKIIIHPPFWNTWWFKLLIIAIVSLCLVCFYRWRISLLHNQQKKLEQTVKEKTKEVMHQKEELQNINDELSTSNEELFEQREELEVTLNSLIETQKKLIQSEKMASLGILAAGVAHEINNPLNFIQGGILSLENYFNDNLKEHINEVTPMINGIQVGVSRAANIVTSLNHYSRHDEFTLTKCNIHSIFDNCLVMLQNEIKNRIEIVKNYTDGTYKLMSNEGKLHQAMLNILANAVQSIEDKGLITITTNIGEKKLLLSIEDSGCGITNENLSKIMDPFFTTKDPGKGTGLGLSITYNIIQEHNGTIEFKSKASKGTIVNITLPLSNT